MEYFVIYLIGTVDTLSHSLTFMSSIGLIVCLGAFGIFKSNELDYSSSIRQKTYARGAKISFRVAIGCLVVLIMSLFIPNSKTLIAMATIPLVINNEQVQKLPENVLGFINEYLEEKRGDLQELRGSSGDL